MTTATLESSNRAAAACGLATSATHVVIATINRPHGSTGVHVHTQTLCEGFRNAQLDCEVVSAFSASKKWLPIFATRRILIDHLSKTWGTRWYRYFHAAALR